MLNAASKVISCRVLGWALARLVVAAFLPMLAAGAEPCPDRGFDFFEQQGYNTRKVFVSGFWLLQRSLLPQNSVLLGMEGQPFKAATLQSGHQELRDAIQNAPSAFDSPVGITVAGVRPVNCTDTGSVKTLDIEFLVFTTKAPFASIHTLEHANQEKEHPAEALALAPARTGIRVTPRLGYDASENVVAGGRLDARMPWQGIVFSLDGQGSTESLVAGGEFSGSREADEGWLRQLTWRGLFHYANLPADVLHLNSSRALGQISMVTAPVGPLGIVFRFGTLFEGGHEQTGLAPAAVASGSVADSPFANWRSYAGFTFRTGRHSVAASYGFLLGRTGSGGLVDYRKHIADAVYSGRFLVAPHRPLELDTRFTAGFLEHPGPTPVAERFFGGNVETPFMPGSAWVIRANPVLRGIPAYRLNRTAAGQMPGGDQFAVVNLTVAIPVFGIPIIPAEASQDPEIREKVQGFAGDGADFLVPIFELDDPAQKELFDTRRESFAKTTSDMAARIDALKDSIPPALQTIYDTCAEKIGDLAADTSDIRKTTPWRNFLKDDPDERGIPVIVQLCLVDLNGPLKDPDLARLGDELKAHQKVIAEQVAKIDTGRARQQAKETMAFPAEVLKTVFDEMDMVSVSPVAIFDAGKIGPALPGQRAGRYSVGGGVRLTFASSVAFQMGYAWNLHPQPWEGRGALFMGIRFIDLFGK